MTDCGSQLLHTKLISGHRGGVPTSVLPKISLRATRAGNIVAIAISQAIADVGLCFVLRLRLSLTLRVPHSPLSSHICPIILSPAPMGCPTSPTIGWGALLPAPLLSTGFRRRATVCCASYKFSDGVIEAAAEEEQPCPCSAPNIWVPAPLSAPVAI